MPFALLVEPLMDYLNSCRRKQRFDTPSEAETVQNNMADGRFLVIYACPYCLGHHLWHPKGSKSSKKWKK